MATLINSRTISSIVDQRAQMNNSYFARGFSPPSGWTQLRLGFRFCFTDLGFTAGSTPQFAFGFCSGETNIFGDATTDHFVGWKTTQANWTRDTGNGVYYESFAITVQPFKRIGTTDTNGSGTQMLGSLPFAVASFRGAIFADLVKGSPNYTLKLYGPTDYRGSSGGWVGDTSSTTFNTNLPLASPSINFYSGWCTDRTLAVDEATNGVLHHINFSWNRTDFALELSDIAVARIA